MIFVIIIFWRGRIWVKENVPVFCVSMNELKEASMCLSSWKTPCFDRALMDFSKDPLNASPSSVRNSYVLKLAPRHVYLCSILSAKIASLLSFPVIQSSISTQDDELALPPLCYGKCFRGTQTSSSSWGWVKSLNSSCHTDGILDTTEGRKDLYTNRRENVTALILLSLSTWRLSSSPRLSTPVRRSSVISLICSHCSLNPWLLVPSATAMESGPFPSSWRWSFKGLKDLAVKLGETKADIPPLILKERGHSSFGTEL